MRTLLILLLCLPALCRAGTASPWDVHQLMQSLAQIKEAKAKFVEHKYLNVLSRPLESSGTLFFQSPARLEKHTLVPKEENLVLNQDALTIDIKARNIKRTLAIQEYPSIWAFVEGIRSTLAGDLPTLERFYKIELQGNAARWKLRLLPLEPDARKMIREIRISGHDNQVESIETLEANDDRSLMEVLGDTP